MWTHCAYYNKSRSEKENPRECELWFILKSFLGIALKNLEVQNKKYVKVY